MSKHDTRLLDELVVDSSLDPRTGERSQERIEDYADNIDGLPPILIDGNNRILDGIHRYYAHQLMGRDRIKVEVVEPASELDALTQAIKTNAVHGHGLSSEDLKQNAIRLWALSASEEHIAGTISRSVGTVQSYLAEAKQKLKEEQQEEAIELYKAGYSQIEISKIISEKSPRTINQKTVSNYLHDHLVAQTGMMHEKGLTEQKIEEVLKRDFPRLIKIDTVSQLIEKYTDSKPESEPDDVEEEVVEAAVEGEPTTEPEPQERAEAESDIDEDDEEKGEESKRKHTEIEYKLLWLGNMLGLSVWVATGDRKKSYKGMTLSEMPGMLSFLPTKIRVKTPTSIERIDVLWLQDDNIVAAFEVEHSTNINSGLLRMSDMLVAMKGTTILTYIVAPNGRLDEAKKKMNRPTFKVTGQTDSCRFIPYSDLRDKYKEVKQNGSISYDWQELLDEIAY